MPVKSETFAEPEFTPTQEARAAAREKFKHFRDDEGVPSGIADDENPPPTDAQLAQMRPAHHIVPDLVNAFRRRKTGQPTIPVPNRTVSIRLDSDVAEALKAGGDGWQTRVNDMLRRALGLIVSMDG